MIVKTAEIEQPLSNRAQTGILPFFSKILVKTNYSIHTCMLLYLKVPDRKSMHLFEHLGGECSTRAIGEGSIPTAYHVAGNF